MKWDLPARSPTASFSWTKGKSWKWLSRKPFLRALSTSGPSSFSARSSESSASRLFLPNERHHQRHHRYDDGGDTRRRQSLPFNQRAGNECRPNSHAAGEAVVDPDRAATLRRLGIIGDERCGRDIGGGPADADQECPKGDRPEKRGEGDKAGADQSNRHAGQHHLAITDAVGELSQRNRKAEHSRRMEGVRGGNGPNAMAMMGEHQRGQHHDNGHVALGGAVGNDGKSYRAMAIKHPGAEGGTIFRGGPWGLHVALIIE